MTQRTKHIRDAVDILKNKSVDFKFDGEMQPDVALDEKYKELYPFSKIVGSANVLIMPAQHSAAISLKMMKTLGGAKIIGPFLVGLGQPIEIAPLRSSTSDILNLASVAAYSSEVIDYKKKIYIYGIAYNEEERRKVINEAKEILDVENVIASILLVEDLSRQSN